MPPEKKNFINVDELMPQLSLEDVGPATTARLSPNFIKSAVETRTRCFLQCGRAQETGDRGPWQSSTITPAKQWHCHQYGCGKKAGNLVSLCEPAQGRARAAGGPPAPGERFQRNRPAILLAMTKGERPASGHVPAAAAPSRLPPRKPR